MKSVLRQSAFADNSAAFPIIPGSQHVFFRHAQMFCDETVGHLLIPGVHERRQVNFYKISLRTGHIFGEKNILYLCVSEI